MNTFLNVVLLSGGIDGVCSTLILKSMGKPIRLFNVDMGYNFEEVKKAKVVSDYMGLKLDTFRGEFLECFLEKDNNFYIQHRNLFFLLLAHNFYRKKGIQVSNFYLGGTKEDSVKDGTNKARKEMSKIISLLSGERAVVTSVVEKMTKVDIILWLKEVYGIKEAEKILKLSTSCYSGINCGNCPACIRLFSAMEGAKIENARDYFTGDVLKSDFLLKYVDRVRLGLKKSGMQKDRFKYMTDMLLKYNLI